MKNETIINIFKRNKKKIKKNAERIKLPLIGVVCHSNIKNEDIKMNESRSKMTMRFEEADVIGDMDLLASLQHDIENQNIEDMMGDMSEGMMK